jgi:hypothetical protein
MAGHFIDFTDDDRTAAFPELTDERGQLAIGVAAQPEHARAERTEALECLRRVRSARADVAADDDRHLGGDLLQHGLQSTKVPMEVVEGRDAHLSRCSQAGAAASSLDEPDGSELHRQSEVVGNDLDAADAPIGDREDIDHSHLDLPRG